MTTVEFDGWVLRVLAVLGIFYALATLLANVLPSTWKVTQGLARISADLRGILSRYAPATPPAPVAKVEPAPPTDPPNKSTHRS